MQNNDNQKTYFIYVRSTAEKVPVTKAQHDSFYKEADRIRHKEQDHGRCMCPYRFIWKCDGDCIGCEYHAAGDTSSLDQPLPDGNGTLGDYIPDSSKPMDEVIADRMLLEQLFARLRELDPETAKHQHVRDQQRRALPLGRRSIEAHRRIGLRRRWEQAISVATSR